MNRRTLLTAALLAPAAVVAVAEREPLLRNRWAVPDEGRFFVGIDWGANSETAFFWVTQDENGKVVVIDRRPHIKVKTEPVV